jgi:uncharacterized protein YndB with AHSA1/START domain
MKKEVVVEAEYPYAPERVWRALTDRRALNEWLMENDFEPRLGHRFQFKTRPAPGFDGIVNCEVLELDEPHKLVYSWRGGPIDTKVTWTLEPTKTGTRLVMQHTGFKGLKGLMLCKMLGSGWNKMLFGVFTEVLKRITEDGFTPDPALLAAKTC